MRFDAHVGEPHELAQPVGAHAADADEAETHLIARSLGACGVRSHRGKGEAGGRGVKERSS